MAARNFENAAGKQIQGEKLTYEDRTDEEKMFLTVLLEQNNIEYEIKYDSKTCKLCIFISKGTHADKLHEVLAQLQKS